MHTAAVPLPTNTRIRAFDWLRGLAVLVMIQCHAMTLLRPELAASPWWGRLRWLDGLVAPSFIFAAGFSLALVQVRGARPGQRWRRVRKTLRRLTEVLLCATLVNWMWFPIFREPKWILRMDILQCIGVALLIALPLFALLAPKPKVLSGASLLLAMLCFGISPLAEAVRGPWADLVNASGTSVFPLLPWAGYVYLGASAGALAATGNVRVLVGWVAILLFVGVGLRLAAPWFNSVYPPHQYFVTSPANHGERWALVCTVLLGLLALELKLAGAWTKTAPIRFVETFGTSSMSGYFFHEMLLYYWDWRLLRFSFDDVWGKQCGWGKYWALTAALIACTYVLVRVMDVVYRRANAAIDRLWDRLQPASKDATAVQAPA